MIEQLNYLGIFISVIISAGVAVGIVGIFKYGVKSKIEQTLENNTPHNFKYLFNDIDSFDKSFEQFYTKASEHFGQLSEEKKKLFTPKENKQESDKEKESKEFLAWKKFKDEQEDTYNTLNKEYDQYGIIRQNYSLFINEEILKYVDLYYFKTLEWMYNITYQAQHDPELLQIRMKSALQITQKLKLDPIHKRTIPEIDEFIKKWDDWLQNN